MKKTISILLAAAMVLILLPTIALAADYTLNVGPGETYSTIQSAVDAVQAGGTGTWEIKVKAGTYNETVQILQQAGKDVIITGESGAIFQGNMVIDGDYRFTGAETLTIRDLALDKSGITLTSHVYVIDMKKYTHNVTIENCAFTGDESGEYTFAVQAGSSSNNTAYNATIRNCTFTRLDCVIQSRCQGMTVENIVTSDTNAGINANNSSNIMLSNVRINAVAPDYALRLGENAGTANNGTLTIVNSVLACPGGDAIVFRASTQVSVVITGSDILGNVVNAPALAVSIAATDVYWGGTLIGFSASMLDIQDSVTSPHFDDTVVLAKVDPSYIIMIPASVDFGTLVRNSGVVTQEFDVTAQGVMLEPDASVDVVVTGPFVMKDGDGSGSVELEYTLTSGTTPIPAAGGEFASFMGNGTQDGSVSVDTSAITAAGSYKGTMVFTITYNQ